MILMNNTHYSIIDTLNHVMGREVFAAMYRDFRDNYYKPMKAARAYVYNSDLVLAYSAGRTMPQPVAATLVDCFVWMLTDLHDGGGDGYGVLDK